MRTTTIAIASALLGCACSSPERLNASASAATAAAPSASVRRASSASASAVVDAPACDVSTDAGALAIYEKLARQAGAADCVGRVTGIPEYVRVGRREQGRCLDTLGIFRCEKTEAAELPQILEAGGWPKKDDVGRIDLARAWLAQDEALLWELDDHVKAEFDAAKKTFTPPAVTVDKGEVRIEGWVERPPTSAGGVTFRGHFQKRRFVFAASGALTREDLAEKFDAKP